MVLSSVYWSPTPTITTMDNLQGIFQKLEAFQIQFNHYEEKQKSPHHPLAIHWFLSCYSHLHHAGYDETTIHSTSGSDTTSTTAATTGALYNCRKPPQLLPTTMFSHIPLCIFPLHLHRFPLPALHHRRVPLHRRHRVPSVPRSLSLCAW